MGGGGACQPSGTDRSQHCLYGTPHWRLYSRGGANAIGQDRPNIVRISAENVGTHLAAYGDPHANTPPPRLTGRSGNDLSTRLVQPAGVRSRPILLRREPPVELHDLKPDPIQVQNLAYDPDYQHVRRRLRNRLHQHQLLDI